MLKLHSRKPRKRRGEDELQKTLMAALKVLKRDDVLVHSIPNEGKRSVQGGSRLKAMGLLPGAADLLFVVEGRTHYLELKKRGEKPRHEQIEFGQNAVAAGAVYEWADNINDALRIVERWQVLTRPVRLPEFARAAPAKAAPAKAGR